MVRFKIEFMEYLEKKFKDIKEFLILGNFYKAFRIARNLSIICKELVDEKKVTEIIALLVQSIEEPIFRLDRRRTDPYINKEEVKEFVDKINNLLNDVLEGIKSENFNAMIIKIAVSNVLLSEMFG